MTKRSPFRYFKTSPEIIRLAVMLYVRFPLSLRNVEDLLHERGIDVSHETVRFWWHRFGPMFASEIRKRRIEGMRSSRWRWHLDEMFVKINGEMHYLWRAVDHEGGRLRVADVAARRAVSEVQSRDVSLVAALDTLSEFAFSIGAPALEEGELFENAAARLESQLADQATRLEKRLRLRRDGIDQIATIRSLITHRQEADALLSKDIALLQRVEQSLENAQALRIQGNAIRSAVDRVRSAIIRREFNDRLNSVWRDLFVRLAPGEPFVPAFQIPKSSTQKLQPKLKTVHRGDGVLGGTPGAMLSAGNLNTAALTLFIALHLSVPKKLPWLILDDPVQSMDDIHIAQFAALLRTLSKEHGRQVLIAVHDQQLFEYLKLELSPAFSEDSLITLELSRGPRRDSVCVSTRFSFKEETALYATA